MSQIIQVPVYDRNESVTAYLRRVEEYKLLVKKEKYDIVLEFINKWLKYTTEETKIKSLTDFKNILEEDLLKDKKNNIQVINQYAEKFKELFEIESVNINKDDASTCLSDKYIIYLFSKVLLSFGYIMKTRQINKNIYYSIKLK